MFRLQMTLLSLLVLFGCSTADQSYTLASGGDDLTSIGGGGRNIMRTAEGALISFFTTVEEGDSRLYFASSTDDGKTWYRVSPPVGQSAPVTLPAVDSNFNGAYMVYVEKTHGGKVGRLIYSPNPLAQDKTFISSEPLTPKLKDVTGSFVAASRIGWGDKPSIVATSVVYGWTDAATGDIYVGVSRDGKTFPLASKVFSSRHVTSSPAVTIHGEKVFLAFLTDHPDLVPQDLPGKRGGGHYPAWMESADFGESWTEPVPLFGRSVVDFPKLGVTEAREAGAVVRGTVFAAGGSPGWISSALAWNAPKETTGSELIFVMSSLSPVAADGGPVESSLFEDPDNLIGVVSFRRFTPGSEWVHVPANHELLRAPGATERINQTLDSLGVSLAAANTRGSQHQYSALVDTPVRATTYVETDTNDAQRRSIVIVSSIDTGKVFDHYMRFDAASLARRGVDLTADEVRIDVSQCLFEGRDGEVFVDVLVHGSDREKAIKYVKLPLGVNAQRLRDENLE